MPTNKITVSHCLHALSYVSFFLVVLAAYVGLCLLDIYLEAGGFKLAFSNISWPQEIRVLLALMGIPPESAKPPVAFAFMITFISIASSYLFIHYFVGVIGSFQGFLKRLTGPQKGELHALVDEGYPIARLLFFSLLVFALYLYVFAKWTMPFAQLQLAYRLWGADFGDTLQSAQVMPDVKQLLEKHSGEFSWFIVTGFPKALFVLHFLTALLAEIFLLHIATSFGTFVDKNDEVIRNVRTRIRDAIQRRRGIPEANARNSAPPLDETRAVTVSEPAENSGCSGAHEEQPEEPAAPCDETEKPEEQQVRVIGGNEMVSPRDAMSKPDLYEVVKNGMNGTSTYIIYTKEFYQKLQEQGGRA